MILVIIDGNTNDSYARGRPKKLMAHRSFRLLLELLLLNKDENDDDNDEDDNSRVKDKDDDDDDDDILIYCFNIICFIIPIFIMTLTATYKDTNSFQLILERRLL